MAISVVFLVLQGCSTRGPEAHSAGYCSLYCIVSPNSPISKLLGVSRAPSTGWWLPLPHLVSKLTDFLSSPSYIIVQSPTQYLWNGMFDHHQVEITVMQFTGHSLPVHQSMTVPWDFTLSHIVSQACLRDFFPSYGQNIVPLLFFYKHRFGIKYPPASKSWYTINQKKKKIKKSGILSFRFLFIYFYLFIF